jgi:rubrerythrin
MNENELLDLLEVAIDAVREARQRYRQGERVSEEPEMKRMFRLLAAETARHERQLRATYRRLLREHGRKILEEG